MTDEKENSTEGSGNGLQDMLDQVVENAHSRLDMAADILRAAVSSIPPEELAKVLLAAVPPAAEAAPAAEPEAAPAEDAAEAPKEEAPKEEPKKA